MDLHITLKLPSSDYAQQLRESLLELTDHDVSEVLALDEVALLRTTLMLWNEMDALPEVVRDAVAVSIGRRLVGFNFSFPIHQEAIDLIANAVHQLYLDVHTFLDPLVRWLYPDFSILPMRLPRSREYTLVIGNKEPEKESE